MVKTNTVVGVVVVSVVLGVVVVAGVVQGVSVLVMFPSAEHLAVMQPPRPSVVS